MDMPYDRFFEVERPEGGKSYLPPSLILREIAPDGAIYPGTERELRVGSTPWHPWQTAPKDGTEILAFFPSSVVKAKRGKLRETRRRTMIVRWWATGEIAGEYGSVRRAPLEEKHEGFWGGVGQRSKPTLGAPSHWMPLPAPPMERI